MHAYHGMLYLSKLHQRAVHTSTLRRLQQILATFYVTVLIANQLLHMYALMQW
jgi:hypothetical protein